VSQFPPGDLPGGRYLDLEGRGTTFYRRVEGPAGAPTVLLLHGWTATSALNWYSSFGPLGERYGVVAIDHRGHGHGIRSDEPFTLEDCADDAAALVEALGLGPVIAVGYSMGGPIAQLLWRRHRELVAGLGRAGPAAPPGHRPGARQPLRRLRARPLGAPGSSAQQPAPPGGSGPGHRAVQLPGVDR
jgi:pimeloyl-ACP methyl ester carboxylesterase